MRLYGARVHGDWVRWAAFHPGLNWIMSVAVRQSHRRRGIATTLLARVIRDLPPDLSVVKLLNIDASDAAMASWAARAGFGLYARQYEMALDLRAAVRPQDRATLALRPLAPVAPRARVRPLLSIHACGRPFPKMVPGTIY